MFAGRHFAGKKQVSHPVNNTKLGACAANINTNG
jgi:hypothetical protein